MRALLLAFTLAALSGAAPERLQIYWIDVEGGAATLIVSPSGESLLVDTGNPRPDDRDARRVAAAAEEAGLARIDYVMITNTRNGFSKTYQAK